MLKVLIVDDDKLVRKGLIYTMPWDDYEMQVIGEANNGKKALEFLEQYEIDILVTDLAMPVMDGIELMRTVRRLYPHIWIVVLTFHQEFDVIQQALRIGAIDYIAKVQLEKEQMEVVLGRIADRIRDEMNQTARHKSISSSTAAKTKADEFLVFVNLYGRSNFEALQSLPFVHTRSLISIGFGMWLLESFDTKGWENKSDTLSQYGLEQDWAIILVTGTYANTNHEWYANLRAYKEHSFYYDFEKGRSLYNLSGDMLVEQRLQILSESDMIELQESWTSLFWVMDDTIFNNLILETGRLQPPVSQLESIFFSAVTEWRRFVPDLSITPFDTIHPFPNWSNRVEWLQTVRCNLRRKLSNTYSEEVVQSIVKAVSFIRHHFNQEMRLAEVAKVANMSRSYFSQCFKDIVGQSFNNYIRSIRIAYAKELLQQTANPIYWVAEKCGYFNEKYFSRVFFDQVGVLPSEFRQLPK
ncbi:response regulator [Paenibacillus mesophilus]|uniref:response regulator n=1 Tax=Paenibacillus mesophilus TaxID=2582849 RepID=UPI00110E78AB|nr:response regulator [Paenibacillus mesophilus]TMV47891.1 response regulator [Paenibacillus mesophilus]